MKLKLARLFALFLSIASPVAASNVIINELMYHPASQGTNEEYIELHNLTNVVVNLGGWKFTRGVRFTFPSNTVIQPGNYLVVAANESTFRSLYPGTPNVVGNWEGTLANGGETIELEDAGGNLVDRVDYADSGDWGTRRRGPLDNGHRGWEWFSNADPDRGRPGTSLELINPLFSNDYGVNWGPSLNAAGSPGGQNTIRSFDIAPAILDVQHFPVVPRSTDEVTINCRIDDEHPTFDFVTVSVFSRVLNDPFVETEMFDDGLHNDGVAGDRVYGAILPMQANNTVVEFYIRASDGDSARTWPAPALDEFGVAGQFANALYQVDEGIYNGGQAMFRLVMTVAEEQELRFIDRDSNAEMNTTLITINGADTEVRYLVGTRIRGAGSRRAAVPNYRLVIPSDTKWNGVDALNVNAQYTHSQVAGSAIVLKGGLQAAYARPIQVRVNGVNFASAGAVNGFGAYALVEVVNGDWAANHAPQDPDGNVYLCRRPNTDLSYLGTNFNTYVGQGYGKGSNGSENDWSDLFELTFVLNQTPNNTYVNEVRRVANVEQWMTYFAFNTLLGNGETSLGTGVGDDYDLYRGVNDTRFIVVQHDLDTILSQGQGATGVGTDIFRATALPVVNRMLTHPEFVPLYYRELKRAIDGVLSEDQLGPLLDRVLGDYVPAQTIDQMKQYARARNAFVLGQIPLNFTINTGLPVNNGYFRTTLSTVSLSGQANAIQTRSVAVNGSAASWNPLNGSWSINGVPLSPGLNRIQVVALDGNGAEVDRGTVEVWYDDGSTSPVSGTLAGNATWSAVAGPHLVSGVVTVPAGVTLTIAAGTTVYFQQGAGLLVQGRLVAEGTELNRIYLTRQPGSGATWGGIDVIDSNEDNRIAYATIDFSDTDNPLRLENSTLFVDHVVFANTSRTLIELDNSSLTVRNSVFPNLVGREHIHGGPIPPGGHVIIDGNTFGTTTGLNDIIDFTGAQRPGPVLQILNNVFTGASDDVLDLDGTDAHVEGNLFMHVHNGNFSAPDTSSAISYGQDGGYSPHVVAVRNLFYDVDHVALVKEGGFLTLENNTGLGIGVAVVNFSEPERGTDPGAGAFLDGNVFWNPPQFAGTNFQNRFPDNGTVDLTVHRSIFPAPDGLTNGIGNLNVDPLLFNVATNTIASVEEVRKALSLLPGSPAIRTGPNGLDRGAGVPEGASIAGEPPANTPLTGATLTVAGPGIVSYRYQLNGGGYGAETSVTNPIVLSGLTNGTYTVAVLGRNSAGVEQSMSNPKLSKTWTVNTALELLMINEVLARNDTLEHEGTFPDQVELYNAGATVVNLSGMGLTDDPERPYRFVFPSGTTIGPGEYLVLYADNEEVSGIHTGFGFDQDGDAVFLFGNSLSGGGLLDSVTFGIQTADLSIGRRHDGSWALNDPTLGGPNVERATGVQSTLKLNEWLADGQTLFQNDFIELYNPQPVPVALGGLYLSDEPLGHPTDHEMAPLSYMGAFGHLVLIADGDTDQGANHLDFKLAPEQGRIGLFAADLSVIDCVSYGPQTSDVSEGRRPSGSDNISFFGPATGTVATPGAPNPGPGGTITITNLVLPVLSLTNNWRYERNGIDLGTGWREIGFNDSSWPVGAALLGQEGDPLPPPGLNTDFPNYNNNQITYYFRTTFNLQQDLSGYEIVASTVFDDGGVVYINGTEVLRVRMPGGTITFGTQALGPTVNNASLEFWIIPGDSLVQGTNTVAVEMHQAQPPSSDIVMGFGLEARRSFTNIFATVVLNEVMANNGTVTAPGDTNITDWVEIYNPLDSTNDLSGMSLSDDLEQPRRWVFPPGVTIPPGGYLVVRAAGGQPPSTMAEAVLNTGFGLSAGGDAAYLFDRPSNGGALIDSINFGLQAQDFSIGRVPNGTGAWVLTLPTPAAVNIPSSLGPASELKINEWLANPSGGDDDYIELFNPSPQPVALGGLFLTDDLNDRNKHKIAGLSFIGVGETAFALFIADGNPQNGADHVDFGLRGNGESIGLFFGDGNRIDAITFGPQENGVSEGRFPDGSDSIGRFEGTRTPGESNILPLRDIVVNEVLSHTDPPFEDAIELYNPSQRAVDLSGWYLSDSRSNPKKFRIPDGTVLDPGQYTVFYEYQFNPDFTGRFPGFGLSSVNGDDVVLSTADASGNLTGYRTRARFGPAEQRVSFGRYETSVETDFVALEERTFGADNPATTNEFRTGQGAANALPKVGPVVISEIMYHPRDINDQDNNIDEYVELVNITGGAVDLFHPIFQTNTWRLRDAVDYDFPMGTTLAAGERLVLLSFDPSTNALLVTGFRLKFGVPEEVRLLGPWRGQLSNNDDSVELYKPDDPQPPGASDEGFVPYVLVDAVGYEDSEPWPSAADGTTNGFGISLQRLDESAYGNDPVNWQAGNARGGRPAGTPVDVLPTFTVHPQDQTIMAGQSLVLASEATGGAPLTYQWRRNGEDIPGAVLPTLTIPSTTLAHAGVYRVRVHNPAGTALSDPAVVTVEAPPMIQEQPESVLVVEGAGVRFAVSAIGTPPLTYQWFFDGTPLMDATNSSLAIPSVSPSDEGTYTVEVANPFGSETSLPATLFINAPPVITSQPVGTNVFVGSNVVFSVTASGSPPLRYQWRRNGLVLPSETNSMIMFSNVQVSDSADYTVQIINPVGSVLSEVARLNVFVPPTVSIEVVDGDATEPGGADTGALRVVRGGSTNTAITVHFNVMGSAVPGGDYRTLISPITIPAGVREVLLVVDVINDGEAEGDETVTVTLVAGEGYLLGTLVTGTVVIHDEDNTPPMVNIDAPADGAMFGVPVNIPIQVSASDNDGSVVRVEVYADGKTLIGQDTSEPFEVTWNDAPSGDHVLTAVALDNLGSSAVSAPVSISVNSSPEISIINPTDGTTLTAPADVTLTAAADDPGGTVTLVEFFENGNLIGTSSSGSTPALRADYRFENNLASSLGGAPMLTDLGPNTFVTDSVDGESRTVLSFAENDGLRLEPVWSVISNDVYTIVMLFSFDTVESWRRILGFKDGNSDNALYSLDGTLQFYPADQGPGPAIVPNSYVQVAISRDAQGNVTGYVDGVQQFSFPDVNDYASVAGSSTLQFFRDNGTEGAAGRVARIRVFDKVLSPAEVLALDRLPSGGSGGLFSITLTSVPQGSYTYTARATDDLGATTTSSPVSILVNAPMAGLMDNFASGTVISGFTNSLTANTTSFTRETGEPRHDNRNGAHSGWVSWRAPASGLCTVDTFGSSFDTVLAVYVGDVISALLRVASNDDFGRLQSRVTFNAEADVVYHIAVDGFDPFESGIALLQLSLQGSAPAIVSHPVGGIVNLGSSLSLSVSAVGAPPLTYQWRHNGVDLSGANGSALMLANIQGADAGDYDVVVSNGAGSVTSDVAVVVVRTGPGIITAPGDVVADPGGEAVFSVMASGTPPLTYQWRVNGMAISGATETTLMLTNVTYGNGGFYQVTVINSLGSTITPPAQLIVRPSLTGVEALPNGDVRLTFDGVPNQMHVIEAQTHGGAWMDAGTVTSPVVEGQYVDGAVNGVSVRLYRVRVGP